MRSPAKVRDIKRVPLRGVKKRTDSLFCLSLVCPHRFTWGNHRVGKRVGGCRREEDGQDGGFCRGGSARTLLCSEVQCNEAIAEPCITSNGEHRSALPVPSPCFSLTTASLPAVYESRLTNALHLWPPCISCCGSSTADNQSHLLLLPCSVSSLLLFPSGSSSSRQAARLCAHRTAARVYFCWVRFSPQPSAAFGRRVLSAHRCSGFAKNGSGTGRGQGQGQICQHVW